MVHKHGSVQPSPSASGSSRRDRPLDLRVGVHSGPVVAGVIGTSKFIYDLWGDTVNVANWLGSAIGPG